MISKRTEHLLENAKSKIIISIGNDIYRDSMYENLSKCSHDAETVFEIFCEMNPLKGNREKSILINNSSKENISCEYVINRIKEVAKTVREEEQLIVYFSGHGERINNDFAMVLYDSDSKTNNNYLTLSLLSELLVDCHAAETLFIFDACFSGINIDGTKRVTRKIEKEWLCNAKGFSVITACTEMQTASEKSPSDLSMFTHFLCKALKGDAEAQKDYLLTVLSLYEYVAHKMGEFSLSCGNSYYQNPTIQHLAEGRLVLGDYRVRNVGEWFQDNCAEVRIESSHISPNLFPREIESYVDTKVWDVVNNLVYEIVSNAFKHGNASFCKLVIKRESLEIWDDGTLFDQRAICDREGNGGGRTFDMLNELQKKHMVCLSYKIVEKKNVYMFTFPIMVAFNMNKAMTITIDRNNYYVEGKIDFGDVVCKYYYLNIDWESLPISFSKDIIIKVLDLLPEGSKLILNRRESYFYHLVDQEKVIILDE